MAPEPSMSKRRSPMAAYGCVSRVSPAQTALRNCTRDEGGPFGFGDQEGLALKIDRDKLTKKGKAEAIKAIKDVLSQLED